ncbi:UDP-N-acetylglucosamine 2-epimerase [Nitrosotalea devaniterrae]|uniref:UDP-N-acetylglucosamine 2-epimerase n=1 Tax=Nitrosotalea devaniterrae TaxID=1078905 RepID=A0A128A0W1_9ARCH|nr:UDP-N-acetylglucosamine 2-epimerase [Candidatus Nitrosotalea devanaterra]
MKFCLVVGTRPQIIKSQPIVREILTHGGKLSIVHTGQHYDYEMSKMFFEELKIREPDINLAVKPRSSANQLAQIIMKLENPLRKLNPDVVLVPGDTRSALGAALCANRLGIKVAHIESGARSMEFDMEEEVNRRIIDHCSNILFAPTPWCRKNLQKESVLGDIHFSGDTMYDVFIKFKNMLDLNKPSNSKSVIMTIHRKDNIEDISKITKIIQLAKKISSKGYDVIFPIHPHTAKKIKSFGINLDGINIIEPVKYSEMLQLLSNAKMLLTDSGGLQKESYWLNTPCVTLRKSTEWVETFEGGHNVLVPKLTNSSFDLILRKLSNKKVKKQKNIKHFGNGMAAKKIVSILLK